MTLLEPQKSLSYLVYLAYPEDPSSAFRITKQRRQDQKRQHSQRAAFQCFVFGPTGTGKSALLNALIGRYANFQWTAFSASSFNFSSYCMTNSPHQEYIPSGFWLSWLSYRCLGLCIRLGYLLVQWQAKMKWSLPSQAFCSLNEGGIDFFISFVSWVLVNIKTESFHCFQKCNRKLAHKICIIIPPKFLVDYYVLIYAHHQELTKSVCSSSS